MREGGGVGDWRGDGEWREGVIHWLMGFSYVENKRLDDVGLRWELVCFILQLRSWLFTSLLYCTE